MRNIFLEVTAAAYGEIATSNAQVLRCKNTLIPWVHFVIPMAIYSQQSTINHSVFNRPAFEPVPCFREATVSRTWARRAGPLPQSPAAESGRPAHLSWVGSRWWSGLSGRCSTRDRESPRRAPNLTTTTTTTKVP